MSQVERVVLKGLLGGVVATRTIFTGDVAIVSPDTAAIVWGDYITGILAPIRPYMTGVMVWSSFDRYLQLGTQWEFVESVVYNNNGSGSGDTLANLVAAPMIASAGGIRKIGRKFWSGLSEASVSGNSLVSGALAAFATGCAAWISLYTSTHGSTISPGIVDKLHVFRPFVSGVVSSLLGTMRRRKPGLGI